MSVGIDYEIDKIATKLNANLWVAPLTYTAYGRAYVNQRDGSNIPEVNESSSKEYVDKLLNDTKTGLSFFVVDNDYSVRGDSRSFSANVNLYFAINTDAIYTSVTERATEYAIRDINAQLVRSKFKVTGVTVGLDAFSEFDLVKSGDDMRPFLLLKFKGEMNFQYNNC